MDPKDFQIAHFSLSHGEAQFCHKFGKIVNGWFLCSTSAIAHSFHVEAGFRYEVKS